jgi:hypothetical protein
MQMMRPLSRIVMMAALVVLAPVLAGCEDIDIDKFDVFGLNKKKPLPGERRDVFPGGVPGVTQGIPPEYLKSNVEKQQAADAAAATEAQNQEAARAAKAAEEAQKKAAAAEAAARPKPKPKRLSAKPATQVTIQPARGQPAQQAPWPDANQQQQQQPGQQQQGQQQDPAWNTAPPPGTFSR